MPGGGFGKGADEVQKALYRLAMVGVVDDYTTDFGSMTYTVDLDQFTTETVDARILEFVRRVEPGRVAVMQRRVDDAPAISGLGSSTTYGCSWKPFTTSSNPPECGH